MITSSQAAGAALPYVVEPGSGGPADITFDSLVEWLESRRDWLERTLMVHGGVLFRGFALATAGDFERAVRTIQPRLVNYTEGQSQRKRISDKVYNSTFYPARFDITLHNELSYAHKPPTRIFFFCETAPETGGETPIVDCRKVLARMDAVVRDRFLERGVRYVKNMHGGKGYGKSWQDHFETDDKAQVELYLREGGVEFEWLPDGSLRTSQNRPAAIDHPVTGEALWFNQATLWHVSDLGAEGKVLLRRLGEQALPTNAYYGDGSPIDAADLDAIRQLMWAESVQFPWQPGDLLMLDNILVAHGRRAYTGSRNILVAMS
jgi:alpha-ketoglutarate-dependent taurine dioxygenase